MLRKLINSGIKCSGIYIFISKNSQKVRHLCFLGAQRAKIAKEDSNFSWEEARRTQLTVAILCSV